MTWEQQLVNIISKGNVAVRGGGLAALAERRKLTESQYFTPEWIIKLVWQSLNRITDQGDYSVLDNSMGSGRWFLGANKDNHCLLGIDTDQKKVEIVSQVLKASGFTVDFRSVGMQNAHLPRVSIALINPPFSITLSSPDLTKMDGITTYGKFGPDTSALSHEYALQQALNCADIVVALLPTQQANSLAKYKGSNRLCGRFRLPRNTFSQEGVKNVETSLCVFTNVVCKDIVEGSLSQSSVALPALPLNCRTLEEIGTGSIRTTEIDSSKAKICIPVTGDKRVRLYAKGERIGIRFYCGLTQAQAMNALIGDKLYSDHNHRYPKEATHSGLGKFLIQAHLFSADPIRSINQHFTKVLAPMGFKVAVDTQLVNRVRRLHRVEEIAQKPIGKWVFRNSEMKLTAKAKTTDLVEDDPLSPFVEEGTEYQLEKTNGTYKAIIGGETITVSNERAHELFAIQSDTSKGEWHELHPPITHEYPEIARSLEARARNQGIDKWLSWDFQFDDFLELLIKGSGANSYHMGLGKTRFAVALALMGGTNNVIVVKSRLFDEFMQQLGQLPVNKTDIGFIKSFKDIDNLNRITLVTLSALKSKRLNRGKTQTLGQALSRKVNTLIVDEGSILSNRLSDQSVAIQSVQPKHAYILDGEIIHGYARKTLPIIAGVAGECRVSQPYAVGDRPYLTPGTVNGYKNSVTGLKSYTDKHVTLEWATNEFRDSLEAGAKREVPRISNINEFRIWVDRFVKRRVHGEPQVTKHVQIKPPKINKPTLVPWNEQHLGLFVDVAESYRQWFIDHERHRGEQGKGINLAAVLQQIQAVDNATNAPEYIGKAYAGAFTADTSKMDAAVEILSNQLKRGKRPILFGSSPKALKRITKRLEGDGIAVCYIDGTIPMSKRTKRIAKLRDGLLDVAVLSIGTCQDGLNLPEMNYGLFYDRSSWEARVEMQSIYRMCRPEQKHRVEIDRLELEGSLDSYQAMVINWKHVSALAGMDYGDEPPEGDDFYHLEHYVRAFVNSVPGLRDKLKRYQLKRVA